jgi:hypothetical protein
MFGKLAQQNSESANSYRSVRKGVRNMARPNYPPDVDAVAKARFRAIKAYIQNETDGWKESTRPPWSATCVPGLGLTKRRTPQAQRADGQARDCLTDARKRQSRWRWSVRVRDRRVPSVLRRCVGMQAAETQHSERVPDNGTACGR